MRPLVLLLPCLLLLSSCKLFKADEEYMPEYLQEDSPLDPPGRAAARAAMRAKYVKDGVFSKGATPEVKGGKILLCSRNPEREPNFGARLVESRTVKVIACEGDYYFVQAEEGQRGYVKETDLINPAAVAPAFPEGQEPFGPFIPGDGELIPGAAGDAEMALPMNLAGDERLMTDSDGRNVVVTSKKTGRTGEFAEREKALLEGKKLPAAPDVPTNGADDTGNDELPESSLDR